MKIAYLVCFLCFSQFCFSQHPPCLPDYDGLTHSYTKPFFQPSLFTDMPPDVMMGYIGLDSACKNSSYTDLKTFLGRQTFNDTIKYLRKLYYEMKDYNPFLLNAAERNYDTTYKLFPFHIINLVEEAIKTNSQPNFRYGFAFLRADIIDHIKVTASNVLFDSLSQTQLHRVVITCNILDTIKGKVLPFCKAIGPQYSSNKDPDNTLDNVGLQSNIPGNCLQFYYCLEWKRGADKESPFCMTFMTDSLGQPLIKENIEYIVFLSTKIICDNGSEFYYSLNPIMLNSEVATIYPIINGIVFDPGNDFGFGTGLTPEQFKSQLRGRINMILNY